MNCQAIARRFHDDGCVIVGGVFLPQEIVEIELQLNDFIRVVVPKLASGHVYFEDVAGKPIKSIHNLQQHSPYFRQLAQDERLVKIAQSIWPDAQVISHSVMFFGKVAFSGSVAPAHQDNAFQNLQPPEDLVCTIAVDSSTPANGALTVRRGSHKLGQLPHRPTGVMGFSQTLVTPLDSEQYPEMQLCMEPGDICIHHTNAVHYSGPNTTSQSRRQLGISYRTTRARRDEAAWEAYQDELKKLHRANATLA
jgi:phytanoyl-CoA hydroxylase